MEWNCTKCTWFTVITMTRCVCYSICTHVMSCFLLVSTTVGIYIYIYLHLKSLGWCQDDVDDLQLRVAYRLRRRAEELQRSDLEQLRKQQRQEMSEVGRWRSKTWKGVGKNMKKKQIETSLFATDSCKDIAEPIILKIPRIFTVLLSGCDWLRVGQYEINLDNWICSCWQRLSTCGNHSCPDPRT